MYRPRERGGFGFDPVSGFRVVEALSRIDSAVGWNVAIANACDCFGAYLDDATSDEIFSPPDTVISGGLFPPRKATVTKDGYRVSGKSLFNSNCHAANWLLVEALVYDGDEPRKDADGNPEGLFMFVPTSDATIVDNWDTMGMRGTGSHDVDLDDVFVPTNRTAPLLPLEKTTAAYSGPMHRLTFWPAVAINGVPALGIAQAAINDFIDLAATKVPAYTTNTLRDRPIVQLRLAKAEAALRAARTYLYDTFNQMWDIAASGQFLSLEQKADCQQAAAHAISASAEAVDLIHSIASSAAIRKDKPFERHFRDVHVITQHAFICESRFEAVGQVRLGLDPEWEFLYF
jgi:alkylation response protein AidB-like acyl-CoA dehydrogenase